MSENNGTIPGVDMSQFDAAPGGSGGVNIDMNDLLGNGSPAPAEAPAQATPDQLQQQQPTSVPTLTDPDKSQMQIWDEEAAAARQQRDAAAQQQQAAQQAKDNPAPAAPAPTPEWQQNLSSAMAAQAQATQTMLANMQQQQAAQGQKPKTWDETVNELNVEIPNELMAMLGNAQNPEQQQKAFSAIITMAAREGARLSQGYSSQQLAGFQQTINQRNQQQQQVKRYEQTMDRLHPRLTNAIRANKTVADAHNQAMQKIASDPQYAAVRAQNSDELVNLVAHETSRILKATQEALNPLFGGGQRPQPVAQGRHPAMNGAGGVPLTSPGVSTGVGKDDHSDMLPFM